MSDPPKIRLARGVAHFNAKRYAKAVSIFSQALRLDPGSSQARYFLAHALPSARLPRGTRREAAALLAASSPTAAGTRPGRGVREAAILVGLARIRSDLWSGRLDQAFRGCEEVLDAGRRLEVLEGLLSFPEFPAQPLDTGSCRELLGRITAHARARPCDPWSRLAKAYLQYRLGHEAEALRATQAMTRLPARYAWMRFLRGKIHLHFFCAYSEAQEDFSAALRSAPAFWPAKAYRAEALLCGGGWGALGLFDELLRGLCEPHRASALAWRGEIRLWLGDYAGALRDLSAAARRGAPLAKCWEGAARLLLGMTGEALRDLGEALRLEGRDAEALVWRSEAHRRSGRQGAALEDASAALRLHPENFWARMNRALARAGMGDLAGMRADVWEIPPGVLRFFERGIGVKAAAAGLGEMRALLEGGLRLARGVRTPQPYVFPLWMRGLRRPGNGVAQG